VLRLNCDLYTNKPSRLQYNRGRLYCHADHGVQDSLGDPLLSNYVWSFATAALPIVTSTIPANNATGVPVNQVLSATFSEAMNCATIASTGSAPTFTLTHLVGTVVTPVPGGVAVNCLGASATFTPGSLLPQYQIHCPDYNRGD